MPPRRSKLKYDKNPIITGEKVKNGNLKTPQIIHEQKFDFNKIKFIDEEEEESHYDSFIGTLRNQLNSNRKEDAISSPELFIQVSLLVKGEEKPLIIMVRKSSVYVEAFGTTDCLWEFGDGSKHLFHSSSYLGYDSNYNTLFGSDWNNLNISNLSIENYVRTIIKENKSNNRKTYVEGWKKHIRLIIFMIAEACRFGPISKEFNKSLGSRNVYLMKCWVHKSARLWEKMSIVDKKEEEDGYVFDLSNDQITDRVIDEIMNLIRKCKGFIKVLHY